MSAFHEAPAILPVTFRVSPEIHVGFVVDKQDFLVRRSSAKCDSTTVIGAQDSTAFRMQGNRMVQSEKQPRLLDRVRLAIRTRHYSPRTEEAYVQWIRRFILFHGKRHPQTMAAEEVNQFLNHLVTERRVAASTQNQALCALLFLYGEVLEQRMDWAPGIIHPKRPKRLPVVLTKDEVRRVLATVTGTTGIVATLLYGTGMRVSEALTLRVKDLDFGYNEIVIRDAKGQVDRRTVLPRSLHEKLRAHLERVRQLHEKDVAEGAGQVVLPDALPVKYPNAGREWGRQWVFPAARRYVEKETGTQRRHHLHESAAERAFKAAVRRAGLTKPATPHTMRHSFATQLLEAGYDSRTVQELLGRKSVTTTMIYCRVLNRGGRGVQSPADQL